MQPARKPPLLETQNLRSAAEAQRRTSFKTLNTTLLPFSQSCVEFDFPRFPLGQTPSLLVAENFSEIKHLSLPCSANGDTTFVKQKDTGTLHAHITKFFSTAALSNRSACRLTPVQGAGTPHRQCFRCPDILSRLLQVYQTRSPSPLVRQEFAAKKIEQSSPDVDNFAYTNAFVGFVVKPSPSRATLRTPTPPPSTRSKFSGSTTGGQSKTLRYLPFCGSATRRNRKLAAVFWTICGAAALASWRV